MEHMDVMSVEETMWFVDALSSLSKDNLNLFKQFITSLKEQCNPAPFHAARGEVS
jgi:mRNA-degrading endonuclease RelE of RelBE toxin-antitoxin system